MQFNFDEFSFEIFNILVLPGIIYAYNESFGDDMAGFLDIWTYYICVYKGVFVKTQHRPDGRFLGKVWRFWKQFRDFFIVCFLVFMLGWYTEILLGADSAFSEQKVEEHFFRRLRHASICFIGVLSTKWILSNKKVMSVASNLADARRTKNFFLILEKIKLKNGDYDWKKINYIYLLQVFNG